MGKLIICIKENWSIIIQTIIGIASLTVAYLAFVSTRKKDLYDLVFKRSEQLNIIWCTLTSNRNTGNTVLEPLVNYGDNIYDENYAKWSLLITALVQSLEIIDMVASSSLLPLSSKPYYRLLKKSINVQILDTIMHRYDFDALQSNSTEVQTFRKQMFRIRNAFVSFN